MPILFFDTETTGFPRHGVDPDHPSQPHIVQLAALLTDDAGVERASLNLIVDPGIAIPAEAAAVHGITDEVAKRYGVQLRPALQAFYGLARQASVHVAHNARFDAAIMETACRRQYGASPPQVERFCTMDAATPVLNLPATARMASAGYGGKPKPPRLEECIRHFFGESLNGAHDAMVDVRACARVFWHLRTLTAEGAPA